MAATRVIEEERGTFTGSPRNPHQGYYAGDFSSRPVTVVRFVQASATHKQPSAGTPHRWS